MNARSQSLDAISRDAVRQPTVAGKFYSADAQILQNEIRRLLGPNVTPPAQGKLLALVVPHAGYMYSGGVAAHAYRLLAACPTATIAVIAPSHFERFPFVSVFAGKSYRTPLGELPVARALAEKLLARHEFFAPVWAGHRDHGGATEHALEVQLPFLQTVRPDCEILPLVMGQHNWQMCETLGAGLAELAAENPLVIIASSDLSHYHTQEEARQLDGRFLELLAARDPRALYEALARRECEACGAGAVIAAMMAAQRLQADRLELLCYRTSGEVSGDFSRVVGYAAASFSKSE